MRLIFCLVVVTIFFGLPVFAETDIERRARLEAELRSIEQDIAQKRGVLSEKRAERTSLERDIAVLDGQIAVAQQQIKHRDITISKIREDIGEKQDAILTIDARVVAGEQSLAQILRRTREIDETSLALAVISDSLSEMFEDIDAFEMVRRELQISFEEMALLREELAARKEVLESRRGEEEQMRKLQVLEKQAIERREKEKLSTLRTTKGQEKAYQDLIAERESQAAAIRSALFEFRDSGAVPFGTAYRYALDASAITGVRAALVLGILRVETNLGENVGRCSWDTSMHPTRDKPVFVELMKELGLDPTNVKVSCKPSYGWGGAMGPAQFIPSTWKLYKERIAKASGENPPNPWTVRTAIFATALLLKDNGADKKTREAERLSALRYFAGWANAKKPAYAFYGDEVMEYTDEFQKNIDILEGA